MKRRQRIISIASLLSIMLGMALLGGSRGVMVPVLKRDFMITDSTIGTMFLISTLGYMMFTYVAGQLINRIGNKKLLQIGLATVVASFAVMFWSPNFIWFTLGYFINGAGNAFLILGVNMTTPLYAIAFQAALLNIIHGCYGLGSALVQRLTGYFISNNISWRLMFLGFMVFHLIILVYVFFTSYPWPPRSRTQPTELKQNSSKTLFTNKIVYLLIIALGFGLMGEHGINNWFVNYMKVGYGINENAGSVYLSLFFVLFTIGRFGGGFVLEKIGYMKGILGVQLISSAIYLAGIIMGVNGLALITGAGLLQAVVYPTIMITVPKLFPDNTAQAMAFISIGTSLINNLGHLLLGVLNDSIGVISSFYILPIWLLLSGGAVGLIYKLTRERKLKPGIS